jgi:hypothetical protein
MTFLQLMSVWALLSIWLIVGLVIGALSSFLMGAVWWLGAGYGLWRWRKWARAHLSKRQNELTVGHEDRPLS